MYYIITYYIKMYFTNILLLEACEHWKVKLPFSYDFQCLSGWWTIKQLMNNKTTILQWRRDPAILSLEFCTGKHHSEKCKNLVFQWIVSHLQCIHISIHLITVFSSMQRMMGNGSAVMLNVAGSLALDKALWQNLFRQIRIDSFSPSKWHFTTDWLLISEGNKSGGVALTRDHPFSPIPHPPIHQHQSTRITSNYSLGSCFRSCYVDFNPSVISSAVLIQGRAGPNQCSKWIFRGIHSLEGRREGDTTLGCAGLTEGLKRDPMTLTPGDRGQSGTVWPWAAYSEVMDGLRAAEGERQE